MSRDNSLCPVEGCTNQRDDANGVLCWRHRQFVIPRMITAIKRAQQELRSEHDEHRMPWRLGNLTKAINEAAAVARRSQLQMQELAKREAGDDL